MSSIINNIIQFILPYWQNRRHRVFILAGVSIGILLLLITIFGRNGASSETLQFVTIQNGTIEENVTAQGKLEPKEYVDVGAQVSGQLKKLHVEIGDVVEKGALLAEIDPEIYEAQVQADKARLKTLEAQLAEQEAQITFAKRQYDRNVRLITSKAISQEVLDDSETSLKVAEARANALKAQIEEAASSLEGNQTKLNYTKIYAPIGGTVVSQTSREGQTLNASQQAPVIVQLANLNVMTVRAQVAEADVMRLKTGSDVYFTTLGALDRRWYGKIRQILPSPEVINEVVLYNALVDVENKDNQLMTGMSTQMFFVLGKAENIPLIPVNALGKRIPEQDSEQGLAYQIRIKERGSIIFKTIHIGLMNRNMAEVRDGLKTGDVIAMTSQLPATMQNRGPRFGPRV